MAEHAPGQQPADGSPLIDRPGPADTFHDAYAAPPQAVGVDPRDGLPRPVAESSVDANEAPDLLPETFVCMRDVSKFVLRGVFGDVVAEFEPDEVERSEYGKYRARRALVRERLKMEIERSRETSAQLYGMATQAQLDQLNDDQLMMQMLAVAAPHLCMNMNWFEVEPVRPQCKYYARQLMDFDGRDQEHKQVTRLCTARRTDNGEFLSLNDMRMHACELRDPCDASVWAIDQIDDRIVADVRRKQADDADRFDVDAALANDRES